VGFGAWRRARRVCATGSASRPHGRRAAASAVPAISPAISNLSSSVSLKPISSACSFRVTDPHWSVAGCQPRERLGAGPGWGHDGSEHRSAAI
jgi:hypothetical protein